MVDAVIAGAGIAGAAVAWQLAERLGTTDAVIVDPRPPLSVTSNRPEANYRDWWPQPAMAGLADVSLALIDRLLADGARIPMDRRGYLYVTTDQARAASMPAVVANRASLPGAGADALDATSLRAEYHHLSPEIAGGIRVRRAGGLDTVALGHALLERAEARGVRVIEGRVAAVAAGDGRVEAVVVEAPTGRQTLATERFVNAAGPFATPLVGLVGADLEIETVLRQKAVFVDEAGVVPRGAPFTILLDGQTLPWTARDLADVASADGRLLGPLPGGIHVKPDDTAGPDAIKLGWAWDQVSSAPVVRPDCPPAFARMVLLGATRMIPGLARYLDRPAALVGQGCGFYARVPDGQPVIGPLGPDGSAIVGALAGFGAMMACGAGALAAAWLVGDEPTPLMRALAPARFEDPSYRAAIREGRVGTGEL